MLCVKESGVFCSNYKHHSRFNEELGDTIERIHVMTSTELRSESSV